MSRLIGVILFENATAVRFFETQCSTYKQKYAYVKCTIIF